jgi:uncharacterized membrane protein (DUF2068 family)
MKRAFGVSAIIAYKLIKAVLEAALGFVAVWILIRGAEAGAATLAEILLEHVARQWALTAATLIVKSGTSGHVKFIAIIAFGDAVLSAVEGLALRAGRWWAPWLVVVATGALLPWEIWELVARPTWVRGGLFVINLAVVVYLLREVAREHRALVDASVRRT